MAVRKKKKKVATAQEPGVYQLAQQYAADCFREGDSENRIAQVLKETYKQLTEANVQLVIHKASQQIAEQFHRDRKSVVALHVKRYNDELKKLMENSYEDLLRDAMDSGEQVDAGKLRQMRIATLLQALDVLSAKEHVLQIHSKQTQVKIFNKLNAKIKEKKVMFNLESLNLQEKLEFLQLVQKAKKTQNELFSIKLGDQQLQTVTEDADFEVIEKPNIEEIKKLNAPAVAKVKPPKKGLDDVTNMLKKALERKALKEIRKKGGDKKGPHIIDMTDLNEK